MKRVSTCITVRRKLYGDGKFFFLRKKSDFASVGKNMSFASIRYFLSSYKNCVSPSGHLHSTINFQKLVYFHLKICLLLNCRDLQRVPEIALKRSSFSNCEYWSDFRKNIFSSTTKFAKNENEEKKTKRNQSVCNTFFFGKRKNYPTKEV